MSYYCSGLSKSSLHYCLSNAHIFTNHAFSQRNHDLSVQIDVHCSLILEQISIKMLPYMVKGAVHTERIFALKNVRRSWWNGEKVFEEHFLKVELWYVSVGTAFFECRVGGRSHNGFFHSTMLFHCFLCVWLLYLHLLRDLAHDTPFKKCCDQEKQIYF